VITHHPSDDSLARLAARTIGAGPRLSWPRIYPDARSAAGGVRSFEAVGGAMLEPAPPVRQSPGALARVLERLDADPPSEPAPRVLHPELPRPSTPTISVRGASFIRGFAGGGSRGQNPQMQMSLC
jgi:putative transcriptional regulator